MNIKPTSVFLHGKTRFDPAKVYGVADELGYYFRAHGWAEPTSDAAEVTPTAADLDAEPASSAGAELQPHDSVASVAS